VLRNKMEDYFARSNRAILRLAAAQGVKYEFPPVLPEHWPPQNVAA